MKQNSSLIYALVLVVGDFLALLSAFTLAYILRVKYDMRPLIEQIPAETYLYAFLAVLPLWILVHGFIGLYRRENYENRFREFGRLIVGSFIGMLVIIGYDFVIDSTLFPARLVAVYGFVLSLGFLLAFRIVMRIIRSILFMAGYGVTNVLIIGRNPDANGLIEELANTKRSGHRIIGVVGPKTSKYQTFSSFEAAIKALGAKKIHSIIQIQLFKEAGKNDEIMVFAQSNHISYKFIPGSDELFIGNIEVELYRGTPVVTVHQTALIGWGKVVKRLFDIIAGIIALLILSPLFIAVAFVQKILAPNDKILFSQTRITQFNKEFKVYKFRTHKKKFNGLTDEEAFALIGKPELIKAYRAGGDQLPNDPRISSFGRILRATSLDELPQLINVILGDISLVGPRALVPQEIRAYQQKHHILAVKSGITGLAQISGRRELSFEERRKLDLYYVQNWTFWLDIVILLRTLRAVINGIGAK